jgi:serine/threonine-protein kinase HipA
MTELLQIRLGDTIVGTLTAYTGDRTFFAFEDSYLRDPERPVLSQSFFTRTGDLNPATRTYQNKLPPFFFY